MKAGPAIASEMITYFFMSITKTMSHRSIGMSWQVKQGLYYAFLVARMSQGCRKDVARVSQGSPFCTLATLNCQCAVQGWPTPSTTAPMESLDKTNSKYVSDSPPLLKSGGEPVYLSICSPNASISRAREVEDAFLVKKFLNVSRGAGAVRSPV